MRIVCISDTHLAEIPVPEGDILIHAGDLTSVGELREVAKALKWLSSLPHPHKVFIAGNHDFLFERHSGLAAGILPGNLTYLQDSGATIMGLKIWGSPWTPWFNDWAFNLERKSERMRQFREQIPHGLDVLITHGPPHGILDLIPDGRREGCGVLLERVAVVRPRLHVFGHIHHSHGTQLFADTLFVNASIMDEQYDAVHKPIVVEMDPATKEIIHA